MPKGKQLLKDGHGWVYVGKRKTKAGQPGHWSPSKKTEVVTTFLATGSNALTSSMTGVPVATIEAWKRQEWWKEQVIEVQSAEDAVTSDKLNKVVDRALEAVADRLEKGDYVFDSKTGKIVRVPVKLRDSHRVVMESIDKRRLLQRQPTSIVEHKASIDDRLASLAEQFEKLVNKNVIDVEEVEYTALQVKEMNHSIHEERSPRLPSGEGMGSQAQGGPEVEGSSGEEQSPSETET